MSEHKEAAPMTTTTPDDALPTVTDYPKSSPKEADPVVRQKLLQVFRETGMIDVIRANVRSYVATYVMASTGDGTPDGMVPKRLCAEKLPIWDRAFLSIIITFLRHIGLTLTVSVALPEAGMTGHEMSISDAAQVTGLSPLLSDTPSHFKTTSHVLERAVIAAAMCRPDTVFPSFIDSSQRHFGTHMPRIGDKQLEDRLRDIENAYKCNNPNTFYNQYDANSLEQRFVRYQREVDKRAQEMISSEFEQWKNTELGRIILEQKTLHRAKIEREREALKQIHDSSLKRLKQRENDIINAAENIRREGERQVFEARQKLQMEINAYQQRMVELVKEEEYAVILAKKEDHKWSEREKELNRREELLITERQRIIDAAEIEAKVIRDRAQFDVMVIREKIKLQSVKHDTDEANMARERRDRVALNERILQLEEQMTSANREIERERQRRRECDAEISRLRILLATIHGDSTSEGTRLVSSLQDRHSLLREVEGKIQLRKETNINHGTQLAAIRQPTEIAGEMEKIKATAASKVKEIRRQLEHVRRDSQRQIHMAEDRIKLLTRRAEDAESEARRYREELTAACMLADDTERRCLSLRREIADLQIVLKQPTATISLQDLDIQQHDPIASAIHLSSPVSHYEDNEWRVAYEKQVKAVNDLERQSQHLLSLGQDTLRQYQPRQSSNVSMQSFLSDPPVMNDSGLFPKNTDFTSLSDGSERNTVSTRITASEMATKLEEELDSIITNDNSNTKLTLSAIRQADVVYGTPDDNSNVKSGAAKVSTTLTMINMIKSFFGTAILAMPKSMNQAGLWSGVVTLFIFGAFANYTMRSLVYQKIELERQGKTINSYGGLGRALYGRWGARAAHFAVISSQLGFCCSYLLFISETLSDMFPTPFGTSSAILTKLIFLLIVIPIPLGLAMLRDLKYIAYSSFFGKVCVIITLICVFYYGSLNPVKVDQVSSVINFSTYPLFFCLAIFVFEGNTLAVPMQKQMQRPEDFDFVVNVTFVIVLIIFTAVGVFSIFFWSQSDICSIITSSFPDSTFTMFVKFALIGSLMTSFAIQMFPVTNIIERYWFMEKERERQQALVDSRRLALKQRLLDFDEFQDQNDFSRSQSANTTENSDTDNESIPDDLDFGEWDRYTASELPEKVVLVKHHTLRRIIFRTSLVLCVGLVAVVIPNFGVFISLMGAIANSLATFILPAVFNLKLFKLSLWSKIFNYIILLCGLLGWFVGGGFAMKDIVMSLISGGDGMCWKQGTPTPTPSPAFWGNKMD